MLLLRELCNSRRVMLNNIYLPLFNQTWLFYALVIITETVVSCVQDVFIGTYSHFTEIEIIMC